MKTASPLTNLNTMEMVSKIKLYKLNMKIFFFKSYFWNLNILLEWSKFFFAITFSESWKHFFNSYTSHYAFFHVIGATGKAADIEELGSLHGK